MSWIQPLVEEYRGRGDLVDIFGVILYTDKNPNIKKVLRDKDYWKSLHDRSGERWAIFSVKPDNEPSSYPEGMLNGTWVNPKNQIVNFSQEKGLSQMSLGIVRGLMVPVWRNPEENKCLLEEFGVKSTENLPLFIVFTHIDDEIVKREFRLKDGSISEALDSLEEPISLIANAIKNILPENLKNTNGVYAAISLAIDQHNKWKVLKKGVDFYTWFKSLLP